MSGISNCVCSVWLNAREVGTLQPESGNAHHPIFLQYTGNDHTILQLVISKAMLVDGVTRLEEGTQGRKNS